MVKFTVLYREKERLYTELDIGGELIILLRSKVESNSILSNSSGYNPTIYVLLSVVLNMQGADAKPGTMKSVCKRLLGS